MTLRKQILTTVGLTLACGVIILFGAAYRLVLNGLADLEEESMFTNMVRAREALHWAIREIDKTGSDWAGWDEARDFVLTGDSGFIERNMMDESLTNLGLNFMVFLDNNRRVVYSKAVALTSGTAVHQPEGLLACLRTDDYLTSHSSASDSKAGVLLLPEGPALVASWPISNNEGEGPVHGTLLMGRYLDSQYLADLTARTQLNLEILRADASRIGEGWPGAAKAIAAFREGGAGRGRTWLLPERNQIAACTVLPDIHGDPGLLLRISAGRPVLAQGRIAVGYFVVALVLVGAAMMAVVTTLLDRFVVGPVSRLTRHVERVGRERDLTAHIHIDTNNELATLGDEFNQMLDDLRKSEEAARMQQQQLVRADRLHSLGVLVSGVAHEINNPNQIIQSHVAPLIRAWQYARPVLERYYEENGDFDLGGMGYEDARTQVPAMLGSVQTGSSRIKSIVEELRDFAREQPTAMSDDLSLNRVVESAVTLLTNIVRKATDRFGVHLGEGLPPIRGNHQRLEQVVINLVRNALQALPDPSRAVEVRTFHDSANRCVVLEVRDEGVGIADEDLDHVQDPFFTTRREQGGTGLGLSICSSIVLDHGGTMTFHSEPGRGTTVRVSLPVA